MKRKFVRVAAVAAILSAVPLMASAAGENNVGTCGLGSKLFEGQSGIAPQVFAVTTNGFAYNTFAMTSGTSGCSQDGMVKSSWKTAAFIDGNKDRLARDLSRGNGESLDALMQLLAMTEADKARFVKMTRDHISTIFPNESATTEQIRAGLRQVMALDDALAAYAARV